MAFLDNSGDIILDAVLTDEGRKRLANGTFSVVRFSLGDDEINYSQFRNRNHVLGAHPSGSGYYDLEILQTPIFEAFTDAGSSLKSSLVTYTNNQKLYLPVIMVNTLASDNSMATGLGLYHVTVTKDTTDTFQQHDGILNGFQPSEGNSSIRTDQGIDHPLIAPDELIGGEDIETMYYIYLDNRLGLLADPTGGSVPVSFLDDDNVATYFVTDGSNLVTSNTERLPMPSAQVIRGPRGTILNFKIRSSSRLREANTLFNDIGSTGTLDAYPSGPSTSIRFIDSVVRIVGATTGYRLDIPIRFVKKLDE